MTFQDTSNWRRVRLRFIASLNPSKSEIAEMDRATEVSFIPMEAVGENGELDLSQHRQIADVETGYTYFREGDVAYAKITPCFENGKAAEMVGLAQGIAFGTTELTVLRPKPGIVHGRFLFWVIKSPEFSVAGEATMTGAGGQKRVPDAFTRNFESACPPLAEQKAIAAFLDRETGKIDALVEEQRRLIALLKEKRQAIISHAVTKGLDPAALRKPSGIDWLGDIPTHWAAIRLKFVAASIQTGPFGSQLHASDYVSGGTPMINPAHIEHEQLVPAENVTVDPATAERLREHRLETGDIVIARRGEMGRCAVAGEASVGWLCGTGSLKIRVCQSKVSPNFLAEVIRTPAVRSFLSLASVGSTMDNLNSTILGEVAFGLPPLWEQEQISEKVSSAKRVADSLCAEATRAIALLQERRAALISAAVTGKIDVRDAASETEVA